MKLTIEELRLLHRALNKASHTLISNDIGTYNSLRCKLNKEFDSNENEIEKFNEINKSLREGFKDLCKTVRKQRPNTTSSFECFTKDEKQESYENKIDRWSEINIKMNMNQNNVTKQRPNTTSSLDNFTKDEYHNLSKDTLDDLIRDVHSISSIEIKKSDLGFKEAITIVVNSDSGLKEEDRKRIVRYCFENEYFYFKLK